MCMKNINTNLIFCEKIGREQSNGQSYIDLNGVKKSFEKVVKKEDNTDSIKADFTIVFMFSWVEDQVRDGEEKSDIMTIDDTLEVALQLYHLSTGHYRNIHLFDIQINRDKVISLAGKRCFYNDVQYISLEDVKFLKDEVGTDQKYVIKVLVRPKNEKQGKWYLQSVSEFELSDPISQIEPINSSVPCLAQDICVDTEKETSVNSYQKPEIPARLNSSSFV